MTPGAEGVKDIMSMGVAGVKTNPTFREIARHSASRKAQDDVDKDFMTKAKRWARLPSNQPGWKPTLPKCPFAGCQEEATEAVTGCNHNRRACSLHMDAACRRYQCTCMLKKATERVKAEEEHKRKNKRESGLSGEYARMARTRQVGARILANLEGTMAIYVITWVSQDIPVRGVTNRCTHGALRERDIGTEAEEEWELDLPKLRHKLLPRPEEAQSDESDDGCDTSEVDSGTDSEGE